MSKTVEQALSELMTQISADEAELRRKKETANTLCAVDGRSPVYVLDDARASVPTSIRSDQFYGQPLASAVRTILEMRHQQNLGAASINELHEALVAGGYLFQTKSDEVARASLRNSLSKNTVTFHKLPNGRFGLLSWYPKAQKTAGAVVVEEEEVEETDTTATEAPATEVQKTETAPNQTIRRR